ncbi:SseB family protein [Streptomyces sp. NBC_00019]|uniref:SseB family protein n=1 Tax=Streptomyces sp. NBC_00019 TaxID=2975623 RepID=UPI00324A0084
MIGGVHPVAVIAHILRGLASDSWSIAARIELANVAVLVPVPTGGERDGLGSLTFWLTWHGGSPVVPVFTSEEHLGRELPSVVDYRLVRLGILARNWPEGDVGLAIDPGSPTSFTLSAREVRTLLTV